MEPSTTLSDLISREWIETNGIGGYASSTVAGAHTRGYHGLLVAAYPSNERRVIVSRLDETVVVGSDRIDLATRCYHGAVHPHGYLNLTAFQNVPWPTFTFDTAHYSLRKEIVAIHGRNTIIVRYELLASDRPVELEVRPFIAGRNYHERCYRRDTASARFNFRSGVLQIDSYPGVGSCVIVGAAEYIQQEDWYYQFDLSGEAARGLADSEDLFTPGILKCPLTPKKACYLAASIDPILEEDLPRLYETELQRRRDLTASSDTAIAATLKRAADQFVIARGKKSRTIIAGYHWFTDWGRDTMISLPGLCLVTGRLPEAREILQEYAGAVSEGMIPNRFPDNGEEPEYNTVDATLWFFVAAHKYLQYSGDIAFIKKTLLPIFSDILAWHVMGTRYGIGVANDGLLQCGTGDSQLTWMDARIGSWVVTPRHGKPVEICALWYNALKIMAEFALLTGDHAYATKLDQRAYAVLNQFNKFFWNESDQCLFDCVGNAGPDASIRPNQIFALSLPFPLLTSERAMLVLKKIDQELLTPFGLRTLSPNAAEYRGQYAGDPRSRDSAYHQGTVWPWLLGPYVTGIVRYRGAFGRDQAHEIFKGLEAHLHEAGVGTISEVFGGDAPHRPGGCIAQAWSVAELLRCYVEDLCGVQPSYQSELLRICKESVTYGTL